MSLIKKITIFIFVILLLGNLTAKAYALEKNTFWWSLQAIDTVKYSRDVARDKADDIKFDNVIEAQVREIANTGATHIAIGTPYDPEFIPFIKKWVAVARKNNLKIWFRGNFSGWEEWFEYKKITREEHLRLLKNFITSNGDLFENGDIFTSCPECENGGPGDPRHETNVADFRKFLIDEYKVSRDSFRLVGKNVTSNYFPMNGDVAKLIMDKETTKALGGIVVIDHYVDSPERLASDIKDIAKSSGGKVILGEFGAPIPDIHGDMSETDQANWIDRTLFELTKLSDLIGINYWTSVGGSTELWNDSRYAKKGVSVLSKYFIPKTFSGTVIDEAGAKLKGVRFTSREERNTYSDNKGQFSMPFIEKDEPINIAAEGFVSQVYHAQNSVKTEIALVRNKENFIFKVKKLLYTIFFKAT